MPSPSPVVKILFVGDMHLGRRASRIPDRALEMAQCSLAEIGPEGAWDRVVETAITQEVQAIAFAGDLVHRADDMFEAALDAGADDCSQDEDGHEIICAPDAFGEVNDSLNSRFGAPETAMLIWKPQTTISVNEDQATTLFKLIEALDDCDDVQQVSANFDVSDDIMRRLSA